MFDAYDCTPTSIYSVVKGCNILINAIGAIPQRTKKEVDYLSVNADLPHKLGIVGIPTIQITTDCVFNGETGNYSEQSVKNYRDTYGCSKAMGEIKSDTMRYLRCSIIGRGPKDNYSLLGWLLSREHNAVVSGYINHFWNGITTLAFARICEGIIKADNFKKLPPMQHVVPADWVTKHKLLKLLAEYFNRTDIKIEPTITEKIDRRLCTFNSYTNDKLWTDAGYPYRPTIEEMVKELAEVLK
jgi:dTDP-4-dehydrorhamnose reductase